MNFTEYNYMHADVEGIKEALNKKFGRLQAAHEFVYADSDSCKYAVPECTIVWNHGETTYLKGKNALRIARHWLYTDPDCLLVYTPGWIYLKCEKPEEITFIYDAYDNANHKHKRCNEVKIEMIGQSFWSLFREALAVAEEECLKNDLTLLSICVSNTDNAVKIIEGGDQNDNG